MPKNQLPFTRKEFREVCTTSYRRIHNKNNFLRSATYESFGIQEIITFLENKGLSFKNDGRELFQAKNEITLEDIS